MLSLISKSSVRKPVRSVFATYLHIIINSLGIERKKVRFFKKNPRSGEGQPRSQRGNLVLPSPCLERVGPTHQFPRLSPTHCCVDAS
ncbi:hypothetical protein VN97_g10826 [Penicillium thymicola]|uniref:Uncharacterized protein n=1 Tax=Penicillium thymicola TaxID=293382 RepID=A0AAI9T956_PENTH|nr:hypothetical protein VN97_g10826 [Penicillium thymicola]